MNRLLGVLFVGLGVWFLLKTVLAGSFLFLLLAAGLAVGAAIGAVGRWAFGLAALFGLIALPGLLFRSLFIGMSLLFRAGPVLLLLFGIMLLFSRAAKR